MPRRSASVKLAVEQTELLERWIRAGGTPQQVVLRAKIVRHASEGSSDKQIAADLGVHPRTVALWRQRVRDEGIEGIWQVAAGRGRKPRFGATTVSGWIERTLQTQPVGATHDYKRHGTTCLFAALHVSKGRVIAEHYPRHRHQEFLRFLRRLDGEFPPPTSLHLILDNYAIHGHARVRTWMRKRPRFVLHFIPTSSSWLNLIERWFAELEQKAVRRGVFRSVDELQRAIDEFLVAWNDEPVPYTWTASVERILAKVERCRQRLEQIRPGCTKSSRRSLSLAS